MALTPKQRQTTLLDLSTLSPAVAEALQAFDGDGDGIISLHELLEGAHASVADKRKVCGSAARPAPARPAPGAAAGADAARAGACRRLYQIRALGKLVFGLLFFLVIQLGATFGLVFAVRAPAVCGPRPRGLRAPRGL